MLLGASDETCKCTPVPLQSRTCAPPPARINAEDKRAPAPVSAAFTGSADVVAGGAHGAFAQFSLNAGMREQVRNCRQKEVQSVRQTGRKNGARSVAVMTVAVMTVAVLAAVAVVVSGCVYFGTLGFDINQHGAVNATVDATVNATANAGSNR